MKDSSKTEQLRKSACIAICLVGGLLLFAGKVQAQVSIGAGIPFDDLISNTSEEAEKEVEEKVAADVDAQVDTAVEEEVDEQVEQVVENSVMTAVQNSAEQAVAQTVEAKTEQTVQDSTEQQVEAAVAQSAESAVAEAVEESVVGAVEGGLDEVFGETVASRIDSQLDAQVDGLLDTIESGIEDDEVKLHTNKWLVMAEPEVFRHLAKEGYIFDAITELPGMGLQLAEVSAPDSFDLDAARRGVMEVVGKDRAEVDLDHLYTAGAPVEQAKDGVFPRAALHFPADIDSLPLRIGMIDSAVDVSHPSLERQEIQSKVFVKNGANLPNFHGTAIASIFTGESEGYRGIVPDAKLFSASVFENDPVRGEVASTISLVKALDWLIQASVDVVNISLAGPPNRLLEAALQRAVQKDVLLLAAAGNGGPAAKPAYPAAYDSVVAVTAVNRGNKVFRLANRGSYLDLAAPGVDLIHARAGGGYATSSGTSFAVPFAAAAAARLRHKVPKLDVLGVLFSSTKDLGPPGRDDIYGYGLVSPGA